MRKIIAVRPGKIKRKTGLFTVWAALVFLFAFPVVGEEAAEVAVAAEMAPPGSNSAAPPAEQQDELIARIGEREIYQSEIDQMIAKLPAWMQENLQTPEEKAEFIKNYIAGLAIYRRAKNLGVDKDPEIQARVEEFIRQLTVGKYMNEQVAENVKVTPEDMQRYYEENKESYLEKAKVKLRMMRLASREKAEEVAALLKEGKDFGELAKEHSEHKPTKEKGGLFGRWIPRDGVIPGIGIVPEVHEAIFALGAGKFTPEPVEVKGAFYFFQVENKMPARYKELDEVKESVRRRLRRAKEEEFVANLIEEIFTEQKVEIYSEAVKKKLEEEKKGKTD